MVASSKPCEDQRVRGFNRQVAIVGIGETAVGKVPDLSPMQFHAIPALRALEDAGLYKNDIDGVLTRGSHTEDFAMHSAVFAEYMGINPRYTAKLHLGGATACAMVNHAASAIACGMCDTVLIAAGDKRLSAVSRDKVVAQSADYGHPQFEAPYGSLMVGMYALAARRHMHLYGTTSEQMAAVAVTERYHAQLHGAAQMMAPLTIEDVLNSRMVADPLHVNDCCLVSDGGAAIILTTTERARDLKQKPILVLGAGEGSTHEHISQSKDLTWSGARFAGERAFAMAGVKPSDIDTAMLYDCFTIVVLMLLEDLGFCAKGEAGAFVASGGMKLGGKLPVNTHGGMLSHAAPGYANGIFHLTEATKQLRGHAVGRQVKDAALALVHGNGGMLSTHAAVILGAL
jgi:acetyl-CoA acetyltransferase